MNHRHYHHKKSCHGECSCIPCLCWDIPFDQLLRLKKEAKESKC